MAPLATSTISRDSFKDILSRYHSTVPDKLDELDTLRYNTIPAKLAERKEGGDAYLEKEEAERLVEWKLKHGTFRPKLLQLVQSNPASSIRDATRKAFKSLDTAHPLPALKILMELKGIGPATASLLLSVYQPGELPFFSDELFRWAMWEEKGKPTGWKRVIKYSVKEYGMLVEGLKGVRERLEVEAVDVERAAWVLGREGVDVGGEGEGRAKEVEKPKETSLKETSETETVKRKVEDTETLSTVVRRSRRKTDN